MWGIDAHSGSEEQIALAGLDALGDFIRELGLPTTLRELGTTEEMLPRIANSAVKGGGYRQLDETDILQILKACF